MLYISKPANKQFSCIMVHDFQSALIGPKTGTQAAQTSVQATANTRVHNVVVDTGSQYSSLVTSLPLQLPTRTFALSVSRKGI